MSGGVPDDSGHRSIAGYFYQSLLTSALPIDLLEPLRRDDEAESMELVSAVYPEEFGQDAVVIAHSGTTVVAKVVQHKFSRWPEDNKIPPSELFEIIQKLHDSCEYVRDKYGVEPRMCLHTNRPLGRTSAKFLKASQDDKPNDSLDKKEAEKDKDGKEIKWKGRSLEKNRLYRDCLKNLEFKVQSAREAVAVLEARASKFGVLPGEIDDRVTYLAGQIYEVMTVAGLREITLQDLDKALTGDNAPQILCSDATSEEMQRELYDVGRYLEEQRPLIHRDQLAEIAAANDTPVTLVVGDGGVGKSAILFEYLKSILQSPPIQFFSARHVDNVSVSWCGELFTTWRASHNQNLRKADAAQIIERLQVASAKETLPTLLLWLDGIDECGADQISFVLGELRPLLNRERDEILKTGRRPRIRLLLTCRSREDYELKFGAESAFGNGSNRVPAVELHGYTASELSRLPDGFLPSTVTQKLQQWLTPEQSGGILDEHQGSLDESLPVAIQPFQHPPLLGALRRVDEEVANECLDQQPEAMKKVAAEYITWFALKACRRRWAEREAEVYKQLAVVLSAIGDEKPPYTRQGHWIGPTNNFGFTNLEASRLFDEAVSAGIVVEVGFRKWNWRSQYVCLGIEANAPAEEAVQ